MNQVVEPGQALAAARELASAIAANAPIAVQQSLQAVDKLASASDGEGWDLTTAARKVIGASEDAREGVRAFFEKRLPRWTGT